MSSKKIIAIVSDAVMPYNIGGKERRLYEITRRLASENREIHIYTMKWWEGKNTIVINGVFYHSLCKKYSLYKNGRRSILQALIFALATFKLFFINFDVLDVDHIPFFPLFSARIVAWVKGKKMYATWHEVWGKEYWKNYMGGFSGIFGNLTESISFRLPDLIISNSEHTTARLKAAGVKCKIKTISLGVDLEKINYSQADKNKQDVLYVGRLLDHKNVDLLVRAILIVKKVKNDISCKIIGDGPEKQNIKKLITELGLEKNISVIDGVEETEILYGIMKASKMLVLPSVREGFGLVVIEANAAGIPVITTSHQDNAAKELITDGVNGYLCNPNAEDISKNILKLLEENKKFDTGTAVRKYDWSNVVKNFEEILV